MPIPRKNEKKSDFISRCIPYVINEGTAKDSNQAVAMCNSIWKRSKEQNNSIKDVIEILKRISSNLEIISKNVK